MIAPGMINVSGSIEPLGSLVGETMAEGIDPVVSGMFWAAYDSVPMKATGGPVEINDDGSLSFTIKQHLPDGSYKVFDVVVNTWVDTNDDYWERQEHVPVVVDHRVYSIGKEPSPGQSRSGLGMAGRQFTIDFFDGRTVVTHNLWAGGKIPEKWRFKFPNTAQFRSGGESVMADGGSAWSSDHDKLSWDTVRDELEFTDEEELQIEALKDAFLGELDL